jgi:hypothetical protein
MTSGSSPFLLQQDPDLGKREGKEEEGEKKRREEESSVIMKSHSDEVVESRGWC